MAFKSLRVKAPYADPIHLPSAGGTSTCGWLMEEIVANFFNGSYPNAFFDHVRSDRCSARWVWL